LFILIIC